MLAFQIYLTVAGSASQFANAAAIGAAFDIHIMRDNPITLRWPVSGRMAIGTTRRKEDHRGLAERFPGLRVIVISGPD
jgi:hypothetical protein